MIEVTIKDGYVENFNLLPDTSSINGELVEDPEDIDDFVLNYDAYKIQNGCLVKDSDKLKSIELEKITESIRRLRQIECFSVVDRSKLWYDSLSSSQLEELKAWYEAWLEAPDTKTIPKTPSWIKGD